MGNLTSKDLAKLGAGVRIRGQGISTSTSAEKPRAKRFTGPKSQAKARARLNKWEQQYAEHLALRMAAGEVKYFYAQALNLRLADEKCYYLIDFVLVMPDGTLEFHEIKGHRKQAGLVKFKVARNLFGMLGKWRMLTKDGSSWVQIYGDDKE